MTFKPRHMFSAATILALVAFAGPARATIIDAADITGLRSFNDGVGVTLLTFLAVKSGTEDRVVGHYDIGGLSGTVPTTTFDIPIANIDDGPPEGIFEVYNFAGDGVVSTDEWNAGTLFHTFTGIQGGIQTLSVDVTSLLQAAVDAGDPFLSFSLRAGIGTDRYNMGAIVGIVGLPDPALFLGVPRTVAIDIKPGEEPNSINLASSGGVPVAILSSDTFDATRIVPGTLFLASAGVKLRSRTEAFLCHEEDVNDDSLFDLVCKFETAEFMVEEGDDTAELTGSTDRGDTIVGTDSIRIVVH